MHVTTLSRSQKVYKVLASHTAKIISENNLSDTLRFVDMGGGFYGGGEANLGAYDEYAKTITAELDEVCDTENVALYVEPGGAVICTPGYYLGRIIDTKDVLGKRFVVSELSRINVDHEMKKPLTLICFLRKRKRTILNRCFVDIHVWKVIVCASFMMSLSCLKGIWF